MKYLLYVALLYIFLPFNLYVDLITILIFFIVFKENETFALIFSFFAGLLIDLYYPAVLGINLLTYVILAQALLYIKKYIAQSLTVTFAVFIVFYLIKIVIIHLILSSPLNIQTIILTAIFFIPVFMLFNKLILKVWTIT